jgi:DNA polymerase-3 subunit alpha
MFDLNIPYVSLHNHTTFSIMDGLAKPTEMFQRAKELGQTAIAVTDHGSLAGIWDCLNVSRKVGIKLIAGCEMNFTDDLESESDTTLRHIILIAKNAVGYENLLTLNKVGFDNYSVHFKKAIPRIDWKLLEQYSEGLICTTACGNGIVSQLIMAGKLEEAIATAQRLQDIFGDDLALELQPNALRRQGNAYSGPIDQMRINLGLKRVAEETGIRCIVATDAHYLLPEHHEAHDVLLAVGSKQPINSGQRLSYGVNRFYIQSGLEAANFFMRWRPMFCDNDPDFIEKMFINTVELAGRCEEPDWVDPKYSNPSGKELPDFPVKDQDNYDEFRSWSSQLPKEDQKLAEDVQYLRYWCDYEVGKQLQVGTLNSASSEDYRNRVVEEQEVLEYRGFCSYMLIEADVIQYARKKGILVGPGRGSAGGSLVARLLDIHQADPFKYGLIFARFINKHKEAYPDIDTDIAPSGRDQIKEYIRQKYGEDHVAHVSNVNTITPKVYARDIARVFEFGGDRTTAKQIGDDIADSISDDINDGMTVEQALEAAPLFAEYSKQYPQLRKYANLIGSKPRAWATHAGGIVIGKRPLPGVFPLRRDANGQISVEYDKERAEANGLVKFDFLGLETLDIIQETRELAVKTGKTPPPERFDYEQKDQPTYDLISEGNTFCVFQLGGTATPLCRSVVPKNVDDISLINALVRPSAKTIVNDLIRTRNGEQKMELMHPVLHRAFASTYGFGLYEECLMYLAQDVAGWDLHSADRLRKLTKEKGKNPKKVAGWRKEFIADAQKNKRLSAALATRIWDEVIAGFGGYGFNKSLYFLQEVDIYSSDGRFISSKPIKDVTSGEFVRSRDETTGDDIYIEVLANHDHGEQEVFEVELESGEKVTCTMEHKFRVQETGEMLPLREIIDLGFSIVVG